MSNRERWIVYPLLFYALVMGFKSTYRDPLEFRCRTIDCQNLNVKLINGSAALANPASRSPTNVIVVRGGEEVSPSTAPAAEVTAPPTESPQLPAEAELDPSPAESSPTMTPPSP